MAKKLALNRRQILETALEIANEAGAENLTMRQVAKRLNVGTMSLYYYVASKDEMLRGMLDLILEQVEIPPRNIDNWENRIVWTLSSFRQTVSKHPELLTLITSGSFNATPQQFEITDTIIESLLLGGLDHESATLAYRIALSYTIGYLSFQLGGFFESVVKGFNDHMRTDRANASQYPSFMAAIPRLSNWDTEREFENGLRRLLSNLTA